MLKWAGASALAMALAACGGGGDDGGSGPPAPGPEAWVAGEYLSDCAASPVSGVIASSRSDLLINDRGEFSTGIRIYAGTTVCAGAPLTILIYPTGVWTTTGSQLMAVTGFGTVSVNKVRATTPAGQITASGGGGYVVTTSSTITVNDPNSANVLMQVQRSVVADEWKDLALLRNNRLYFGVDTPLDANGYPTAIDTTFSAAKV